MRSPQPPDYLLKRTAWKALCLMGVLLLPIVTVCPWPRELHPGRIQEIMRRPEFHNSRWGMAFYSPDTNQFVYSVNSDQLFQPASAAKVFVAGTAFSTLGPDYRFPTSVYRTGPVSRGVLNGDLVLVAGGDLLLSSRIQPDGTLALPEPDHTYDVVPGAAPVPGDPLRVVRGIAAQVAAYGIQHIEGRVLVDASLFREGKAETGMGAGTVPISPIMINDNIVDVLVTPGKREGEPGILEISPQTAYVRIINETRTTAPSEPPAPGLPQMRPGGLRFANDILNADGTHTVTLTGNVSLGGPAVLRAYRVPEPVRFAQTVLTEALRETGITARVDLLANPDFQALAAFYTSENKVAEHVSPPLSEEVKVTLKVSSNLHTAMFPYLVGAIAKHDKENARRIGDECQRRLFEQAGIEAAAVNAEGKSSADTFVKFLTYMSRQQYFRQYMRALPVMGRDGSLAHIQVNSPAAGHVYAKTGTGLSMAASANQASTLTAGRTVVSSAGAPSGEPRFASSAGRPSPGIQVVKALAGYIELPNGRLIAFAEFLEFENRSGAEGMARADQVMGEIAAVVYESFASPSSRPQAGVARENQ